MKYTFEAGSVTFYTQDPITIEAEDMEEAEGIFIAHMAEGGKFTGFRALIAEPGKPTAQLNADLSSPSDKPYVPSWATPGASPRLRKRAVRMATKKAEALAKLATQKKSRKKK
jgi:hypothetical protein